MAKNLILLSYGMTLGFPTIVIPSVMKPQYGEYDVTPTIAKDTQRDPLQLNLDQISWFSSINLLCVPVGCAVSGLVTQPIGRKKSMLILNIPFIGAWILYRYTYDVAGLYAALAITGLTGGLLEAPVLTYVAEITEPSLRGILSASSSTCVILGVFIQFLMGNWLHWRDVALVNTAFPVAAFIALLFVPESPYWLVGEERFEDARASLQWLRGWVKGCDVEKELSHLMRTIMTGVKPNSKSHRKSCNRVRCGKSCKESSDRGCISKCNKCMTSLHPYGRRTFLRPFTLVCFVFFVGHMGGMTTLQTYAVSIFAEVGSPLDKYVSTVLLGLVQLVGALICVATIKFSGKKPLAIVSSLCSGLLMLAVAINTKVQTDNGSLSTSNSWLPLIGLAGSAFASHICLRLLPWILIGEVFPPRVRGTASGISGGAGYLLGFAANKSYLYLVGTLGGVWATLTLYSFIAIFGALILYFILPETEGLTLEEIQDVFEGVSCADDRLPKAVNNTGKYTVNKCGQENSAFQRDSQL